MVIIIFPRRKSPEKVFLNHILPFIYVDQFKYTCWEDYFLKINKCVVPNKGMLDGKTNKRAAHLSGTLE